MAIRCTCWLSVRCFMNQGLRWCSDLLMFSIESLWWVVAVNFNYFMPLRILDVILNSWLERQILWFWCRNFTYTIFHNNSKDANKFELMLQIFWMLQHIPKLIWNGMEYIAALLMVIYRSIGQIQSYRGREREFNRSQFICLWETSWRGRRFLQFVWK
jgi:hypothetical protein